MSSIAPPQQIASASAVLFGRYGDVTRLAHERGCSRQALYRETDAALDTLDGSAHRQQLEQRQQRLAHLQARCDQLEERLRHAVVIDPDKRAEFAATAQATGVSLPAARALLAVFLGRATPSVATLGRLAQGGARQATALLPVFDEYSRARAEQIAGDELFSGRKPVLMTVEQESLCWLGGRLAPSRDGEEWAREFRQLPAAQQLTRDGGQGLEKGLALVNAQRRKDGRPEIADQDDHFHILHRGRRALRQVRQKAARALKKAEQAQKPLDQDRRRGVPLAGGRVKAVGDCWRRAEAAFDRWAAQERSWLRLQAALRLFTPQGELNTRAGAEAEVAQALAGLTGPEWSRLRARLVGPKAFTFLDRVHEQLAALSVPPAPAAAAGAPAGAVPVPGPAESVPAPADAVPAAAGAPADAVPVPTEPVRAAAAGAPADAAAAVVLPAELVQAAVEAEGLRRTPGAWQGEGAQAAARRGVLLASGLILSLAGESGTHALEAVRQVLRQAWRASSLVEGLNSVLRMQQARQKRLTQGLLDLKRLYWNTHTFRAGKRKGHCPYGLLGVALPEGDWWQLLQMTPEQLRQKLSELNPAP